jgi:ketosteroid isomerase-like protein
LFVQSTSRKEAVEAFLAALEGFKPERVGDFLTDDVRWWWPQSAVEQGFITTRCAEGREAVLVGVGQAPNRSYRRNHLTLLRVIEDGEMVAAHFLGEGQTHSGNDFANEYVILFRFAGALIAEGWFFLDTAYAYSRIN